VNNGHQDCGNYDSLEYKGLDDNHGHLDGVELVEARNGNAEEQQALHGKNCGMVTETLGNREIEERKHI
jgi:hypothetical protein